MAGESLCRPGTEGFQAPHQIRFVPVRETLPGTPGASGGTGAPKARRFIGKSVRSHPSETLRSSTSAAPRSIDVRLSSSARRMRSIWGSRRCSKEMPRWPAVLRAAPTTASATTDEVGELGTEFVVEALLLGGVADGDDGKVLEPPGQVGRFLEA